MGVGVKAGVRSLLPAVFVEVAVAAALYLSLSNIVQPDMAADANPSNAIAKITFDFQYQLILSLKY